MNYFLFLLFLRIIYHHIFRLRAVGHAEGDEREHVAVVFGQVAVVLGEQLRVGESDDGAVDTLHKR